MEVTNGHAVEIVVMIIGLLLTVIGFFLSFYFRRSIKTTDELSKSVTSLTATVSVLNETMRNYDERTRKHEEKIEEHDRDITMLKTKVC